jgi:hypothetical protein
MADIQSPRADGCQLQTALSLQGRKSGHFSLTQKVHTDLNA